MLKLTLKCDAATYATCFLMISQCPRKRKIVQFKKEGMQRDLNMGVCFSHISSLLAAVVQLLLWGRVNSFSHKIFDFCRQLPETEISFFNKKKNKKFYVIKNQL